MHTILTLEKKKKGINSLTKWIWWFHRLITRLKELEWRVGSAWGWGRAPHFIVIFEDSAKILKELLSAAAGIISFIRIRALNACLNHKILLRNGNTVPRNSRTLQRQHMLKLEAVFFFLLLKEKEIPLSTQFPKLPHLWEWMSYKSLYMLKCYFWERSTFLMQ